MGYVSYLEDIEQRAYENRMMLAAFEDRLISKPAFVSNSPPLQPAADPIAESGLASDDALTTIERVRQIREMHMLALCELMPGKKWRH